MKKTTTTAERKSLYRESTEAKENPFKKSSEMDLVFGFISLFFRGLGIFSIHENEGSSVVFER